MTVRVWFKPSDLGESGYSEDLPIANAVRELAGGQLQLLFKETGQEPQKVGRVNAGRWDAYVLLDEDEPDDDPT